MHMPAGCPAEIAEQRSLLPLSIQSPLNASKRIDTLREKNYQKKGKRLKICFVHKKKGRAAGCSPLDLNGSSRTGLSGLAACGGRLPSALCAGFCRRPSASLRWPFGSLIKSHCRAVFYFGNSPLKHKSFCLSILIRQLLFDVRSGFFIRRKKIFDFFSAFAGD
jgi:hypothetical protein